MNITPTQSLMIRLRPSDESSYAKILKACFKHFTQLFPTAVLGRSCSCCFTAKAQTSSVTLGKLVAKLGDVTQEYSCSSGQILPKTQLAKALEGRRLDSICDCGKGVLKYSFEALSDL